MEEQTVTTVASVGPEQAVKRPWQAMRAETVESRARTNMARTTTSARIWWNGLWFTRASTGRKGCEGSIVLWLPRYFQELFFLE